MSASAGVTCCSLELAYDVLARTPLEVNQHCGDNTLIQLLSSGV